LVTLSDGGGSFTDAVNDADNNPTNEIQTLSKTGNLIKLSDGGSVTDEVDDADNKPNNELQTISKSGSLVTLSDGGGSFIDAVIDADNNPTNELQTLSLSGSDLTISNGNTVGLPSVLPIGTLGKTLFHNGTNWQSTNNLYNNGINIGIGTTLPTFILDVNKPLYGGILSQFKNTAIGAGSVALRSESIYDTYAYLSVQGDDPFDGHYSLGIDGDEIGVLGLSYGTSESDNYGVYGYSNGLGVYGKHAYSGYSGYLGGLDYGAYGQYSSTRYGYLGGSAFSVYGQYGSDIWGSLGNSIAAVEGRSTNPSSQAYAGWFLASHSSQLCIALMVDADYTGSSAPPSGSHVTGIKNQVTSTKAKTYGIYNDVNHNGTNELARGIYTRLDVTSNHSTWAIGIDSDIYRGNDSDVSFAIKARAVDGSSTYGIWTQAYNGITNYAGYFSGNVNVTGTFTNPSDKKFKENISPIISPLTKIKQLNAYSYNYKTTGEAARMNFSSGLQYGFIAQELGRIFPELVSVEVHPYEEIIVEGEEERIEQNSFTYKGINYIGMIPVLTEAIKEQQSIIESQQSAIDNQQKEIDELKVLVRQLVE